MFNHKFIGILALLIAFVYVVFPIDLIPDIIPIVGWVDDIMAIVMAVIIFLKF